MKSIKIGGNRIIFVIIIFLISVLFVNAQLNVTKEQAYNCLSESNTILSDLKANNFSVQRVVDNLKQLENLYNAQIVLMEENKSHDFSLIIPYCDEIKNVKELAYEAKDKLVALKIFYKDSIDSTINSSSVDEIINEAESEMKNERYEKVTPLIDKAYQEIINLKSSNTSLKLFYETTSQTLGKWFMKNIYYIFSILILIIVFFIIYWTSIKKLLLKRKIEDLLLRKKTLKQMVMDTQKSYYIKGNISDGTFNIKTKKLGELIRDIERQIPLLEEELTKLTWKNKKKRLI